MWTEHPAVQRARDLLTRPVIAGVSLLIIYAVLSLFMDPGGYLGTDTGAKVYTLEVMDRNDTTSPDIGYWAEEYDPDGRLHPLYQSDAREDGGWVAVTTLPILEAARPLYELGGYRAVLLLPMLGSVGTAFAARAVTRRVGGDEDEAWLAFWVVGLASPAVVYALDFWEHSIGLACTVGAVALLLDVLAGRGWWRALVAGALLGSAAVLRNETLVYTLVAVGTVCVVQLVRKRAVIAPVVTGVATVAGFAVPWFANVALERAVDGPSRASRASGTATRVGEDSGERVREAFQTLFGLNAGSYGQSILLGLVIVGIVLAAFRAEQRDDRRFAHVAIVGAGVAYVLPSLDGLGFIPGMLVAFPLAIAGIRQLAGTSDARLVAIIAIAALPVVYAFQYVGGGAPQWGGRYTLASGVLLGSIGLVGLVRRYPTVGRDLIALSVVVSMLGVAWLGVRSRGSASFFEELIDEAEPVVISRNAFLIREGGDAVVDRRWLSTNNEDAFSDAVDVTRESGEERFTVLEYGDVAPPPAAIPDDAVEVERQLLHFVEVPVGLLTYEFVEP